MDQDLGETSLLGCQQEDDQRLKAMPSRTVEHVLALLPASVGNTPRDAAANDRGNASDLTGADVRMAAAATVANLSQSLPNRCPEDRPLPAQQCPGVLKDISWPFRYWPKSCDLSPVLK